jgi:hypothetical protein
LFAGLKSDRAAVIQRAQPPDFGERALQFAIKPRKLQVAIDLMMRVDA